MRIGLLLPPVVLAFLAVNPATSHHSDAMYDVERTLTLAGEVVRYHWGNPHVYIHVMVESGGGEEVWEVEAGSPTMMERSGWFANTLQVGDRVIVQASPAKNSNRRAALLATLQRLDGSPLYERGAPRVSSESPPQNPATSLSGNWLPTTPAFIRYLGPPSEEWPLTEKSKAAFATHADYKNESQNCVSISAPFLMTWNDLKQIEVGDQITIIRAALIDDVEREIHMKAESHDGSEPTNQGHSIGHWEGDVLVVDTIRFLEHASGIREGVPSSPQKHLTERFALSSDRTRLTYSYKLDDPEYLTEPVMGSAEWAYRPDLTYTGYECDREVAGRFLAE
jgi:hypothetical protein